MLIKKLFFVGLLFLLFSELRAQVVASFSASETEACGVLQTTLFDNSTAGTENIVQWMWQIGSLTFDKQNPGTIIDEPGIYDVCLTVTTDQGSTDTKCVEGYIKVYGKPTAKFQIDKVIGCSPLEVSFTDLSNSPNGDIATWKWDIGGSANLLTITDPSQDVKSTYTEAGTYSMTLSVEDDKGCVASISYKDILTVDRVKEVFLTKTYLSDCKLPWKVQIENQNISPEAEYTWDFGNGVLFNGAIPPPVDYGQVGEFDVTVRVQEGECEETFVFDQFVKTSSSIELTNLEDNYCLGDMITLNVAQAEDVDSIVWNVEPYGTFRGEEIVFQADMLGCSEMKIIRYRPTCIDSITDICVNVRALPIPAFDIENQNSCIIPATIGLSGDQPLAYQWKVEGEGFEFNGDANQESFEIENYGEYYASFIAKDRFGCEAVVDSVPILLEKFEAALASQNHQGCTPLSFSLAARDEEQYEIIDWQWTIETDNGDITSRDERPSFTIQDTGEYDVQLIAINSLGCIDTIVQPGYVQVGMVPNVDFVGSPLIGCMSEKRTLRDLSDTISDDWIWQVGDTTFYIQDVEFNLPAPGNYTVYLTAFHNGCAGSTFKPDYLTVLDPISNYQFVQDCEDPYTVELENLTAGADSMYWVIKEGALTIDTIRDSNFSSYTFDARGEYNIYTFASNFTTGCEHEKTDTFVIADPIASYEPDTLSGCLPLVISNANNSIDMDQFTYLGNGFSQIGDSLIYDVGGSHVAPELVITDVNGCTDTFQYDGLVLVNEIDARVSFDPVVCIPDELLIIDLSIDSFANVTDWSWTIDGELFTSDSVVIVFDTVYQPEVSLTVTDEWGCQDSIDLTDDIIPVDFIPDFTADTIGCTWGELLFVPSGFDLDLSSVTWSFGDGETSTDIYAKHIYDTEGKYDVCLTIINKNGCEKTICKESYIDIADPIASFDADPKQGDCPPLISNFINNSENATGYLWDFGDGSGTSTVEAPSHIYLEPGDFNISLIASRSEVCKDTLVQSGFITLLGPVGELELLSVGNCLPLDVTLVATSMEAYNYVWDSNEGVLDSTMGKQTQDTIVFTYDNPGRYVPKIIMTDDKGCSRPFRTDPIFANKLDVGAMIMNTPLCDIPVTPDIVNESLSTSGNIEFSWLLQNEQDSFVYYTAQPEITITDYGTYDLRLIGTVTNCSDTLEQEDFITVEPYPTAEMIIDDNNPCVYNPVLVSLDMDGDYRVEWYVDGVLDTTDGDNFIVYSEEALTYEIEARIYSAIGCMTSVQKLITYIGQPIATLPEDILICQEESASLQASIPAGAVNYNWSAKGDIICTNCLEIEVSPKDTTTYVFEVENANGCIYTDSMRVLVAPVGAPSFDLTMDTLICAGSDVTLEVLTTEDKTRYDWYNEGEIVCNDCISLEAVVDDVKVFEVLATNIYECQSIGQVTVDVEKSISDFLVDEVTVCTNDSLTLTTEDVFNVRWYDSGAEICRDCPELRIKVEQPTTLQVRVNSALGCEYQEEVTINTQDPAEIEAGDGGTYCLYEPIRLNGQGFGDITWSYAGESVGTTATVDYRLRGSGYHTITSVLDLCTSSDSIYITALEKVSIEALGDSICPGDIGLADVEGDAFDYAWYDADWNLIEEGTATELEYELTKTIYAVGSRTTCISDTAVVEMYAEPIITYDITESYLESSLNLEVSVPVINDLPYYSYQWPFVDAISCTTCASPTFKHLEKSEKFEVVVTDERTGCQTTRSIFISVDNSCSDKSFELPNVFTPNSTVGDGRYRFSVADEREFISMNIFDRWGNRLKRLSHPDETWDGTFGGQQLSSGVYPYIIKAYCIQDDMEYEIYGDITIVR